MPRGGKLRQTIESTATREGMTEIVRELAERAVADESNLLDLAVHRLTV